VTYLLIAVFGAAGAVSRYALDGWISDLTHGQFPWGTFVINVAGAFALGIGGRLPGPDPAGRSGLLTTMVGR
jgi:CrcB protein